MEKEIKIARSNLADIAPSTAWLLLMPTEAYIRIARRAGWHGIEYHPLGRLSPFRRLRVGLIITKEGIITTHQSFRTEESLGFLIHQRKRFLILK